MVVDAPICTTWDEESAPWVLAASPATAGFALHAQVVPASVAFDEQDAVSVTLVVPVIDEGFAVSEQPDGVPAAGGVAGLHVNVVPLKDQLQRFDGSEIVKPPAWAGVTNAGAAIRAAAASTRPT
jgi:hypothetical protein